MSTRVLIVDDEPLVGQSIALVLKKSGMETTWIDSGKAALDAARDVDYDIAICDLLMPDMDGFATISALHELKPDLPVIALTGGARRGPESMLEQARSVGAEMALMKPVTKATILESVQKVLGS